MKISNLKKSEVSSKADLILIVQNGVTRTITLKNLLGMLEDSVKRNLASINGVKEQLSRKTVDKNYPSFSTPVVGADPTAHNHLSTKRYVDNSIHNVLRNDGSVKLTSLEFKDLPTDLNDLDVIPKAYADDLLLGVLKTIQVYSEDSFPAAKAGDSFMFTKAFDVFGSDGPEVQEGDIMICIDDSEGGTYSEVGVQFAIINTNVVSATEEEKGILKLASSAGMHELVDDKTAVTPKKFKTAAVNSSLFNRTVIDIADYIAVEKDKGIIAVDARREAITITLPTISSLTHPMLAKYIIKDEFGKADSKSITITAGASNTIDGKNSIKLTQKYQAVSIYNDGKNYYIESNTHAPGVESGILISTGKKYPLGTGSDEVVYSAELDLSQFDVNEGFTVEAFAGFVSANSSRVKIKINNVTITDSAAHTAIADARLFATVLKQGDEDASYTAEFGTKNIITAYTNGTASLDQWSGVVPIEVTVNCSTSAGDAFINSLIVRPLK